MLLIKEKPKVKRVSLTMILFGIMFLLSRGSFVTILFGKTNVPFITGILNYDFTVLLIVHIVNITHLLLSWGQYPRYRVCT